jgi:hypothetical protein
MRALAGLGAIGGALACCGVLFVALLVGLIVWYWRRQPNMAVSATPPEPPIQATIEHPTAATAAPAKAPEPAGETPPPPPAPPTPGPPAPPSADV